MRLPFNALEVCASELVRTSACGYSKHTTLDQVSTPSGGLCAPHLEGETRSVVGACSALLIRHHNQSDNNIVPLLSRPDAYEMPIPKIHSSGCLTLLLRILYRPYHKAPIGLHQSVTLRLR